MVVIVEPATLTWADVFIHTLTDTNPAKMPPFPKT